MGVTDTDPAREALRIVTASREAGLTLRVMGGVAVSLRCPSAQAPPLRRAYGDVDLAGRSSERPSIERLFEAAGYVPDEEVNLLHGRQRLIYWDPAHGRQADVLIDRLAMCHELELGDRLALSWPTLPLADLLMTKLQVFETADKDYGDIITLLIDHPLGEDDPEAISVERVTELCSSDWGLWRTTTEVLRRTRDHAGSLDLRGIGTFAAAEQVDALLSALDAVPKSRRWKLRARVGDRVQWYEQPEEAKAEPWNR